MSEIVGFDASARRWIDSDDLTQMWAHSLNRRFSGPMVMGRLVPHGDIVLALVETSGWTEAMINDRGDFLDQAIESGDIIPTGVAEAMLETELLSFEEWVAEVANPNTGLTEAHVAKATASMDKTGRKNRAEWAAELVAGIEE